MKMRRTTSLRALDKMEVTIDIMVDAAGIT